MAELLVCDLGTVPYRAALDLQEELREARIAGELPDTLLLLEHPPVITRGRRSRDEELPLGEEFLASHGVELVTTQRGGLATYHGPGMLVGYPIVGTSDVVGYLRLLEEAIVAALAAQGVSATRRESTTTENLTGVWVGGPAEAATGPWARQWRKIASLGVHVSRGVATHGFAIGADNDLTPWEWFTPCGLPSVRMTSIGAETGRSATLPELRAAMGAHVGRALGLSGPRVITQVELAELLPAGQRAAATLGRRA